MIWRWLALIVMPVSIFAGTVRVEVDPNPVYAGEYGQIILHLDTELEKPIEPKPTDDVTYLRKTFQRIPPSTSYEIPFLITTPGNYTVPPITLPEGLSPSSAVTVPEIIVEDNGIAKSDVFSEGLFELTSVYAGQRLPFSVSILVRDRLTYSREKAESGPRLMLEIENVQWRQQPGAQTDTRFITRQFSEKRNGEDYTVIQARGSCFPVEAGQVAGRVRHLVPILIEEKPINKFAGMFDTAPKRTVWIPVESIFDELTVKELPIPQFPEAYSLGLIGDFAVNLWLDKNVLEQDDLLTLSLSVTGVGNLEHIKAPDLKLDGWAVYKPDVSVNLQQQRAEIRWVLQPQSSRETLPELSFSFFSASKDQWLKRTFKKEVTFSSVVGKKPLDQLQLAPASGIALYSPQRYTAYLALVLFLLGPVAAILTGVAKALKKPEHIREFERSRHEILKELTRNHEADLSSTMSNELLPALRRLYGLPPGASVEVIRGRLDDDGLGTLLDRLYPETYQAAPLSTDRKEVIAHLSRFQPLVVIAFILPLLLFAESPRVADAAYLKGNYGEAIKAFERDVSQPEADVSAMINLGNSYFMDKQYVKALLCAERSLLIAPRNQYAVMLYQKCLPKLAKEPRSVISDLAPDEWMLIAAVSWLAGWLLFLPGNKRKPMLKYVFGMVFAATALVSGFTGYHEYSTTYNQNAALVLSDVEMHYAPESSDGTGIVLSAADRVLMVDDRPGWALIKSSRGTGWIPRDLVAKLMLRIEHTGSDQR